MRREMDRRTERWKEEKRERREIKERKKGEIWCFSKKEIGRAHV